MKDKIKKLEKEIAQLWGWLMIIACVVGGCLTGLIVMAIRGG